MNSLTSQSDVFPTQVSVAPSAARPSAGALSNVSIVIPVGPNETSWPLLLADLAKVDEDAEWLFVATQAKPKNFDSLVEAAGRRHGAQWIVASAGRAKQMNRGANLSGRQFVWFLHADSRVDKDATAALARSLKSQPQAVHFFDLEFQGDGPRLARLNALGARFRSRWLGLPFGDQGLCLSRDLFWSLGGFNEEVSYGEDHLLVWAARRRRTPLRPVGATIATSARKYQSNGWLPTTALHGWRTWRQAIPQLGRLIWSRWR